MYNGLLHLHSLLRWVILILLLVAVYRSLVDRNSAFTNFHRKTGLLLVICCDIMLLLGLYQWFAGSFGLKAIQQVGFTELMSNTANKFYRFFAIEHFAAMIIAIVLVHVGRSYAKKDVPDAVKHKRAVVFFGLALLIILISIPWPFREVGHMTNRHWFPGL